MIEIFTKKIWFSNVKNDLLAGAVIALILIPEAIAFSRIAGVNPQVGLYSSGCIATITALIGGRTRMISGTAGAMALLMHTLAKDYEIEYLLATTILTGIIQIILGWIKLSYQMHFVSRAVKVGFVNALAILIFGAQLDQFKNVSWLGNGMVAMGLIIIYGLPRLTTVIPSPLVAIVGLTTFSLVTRLELPTIGNIGTFSNAFPVFVVQKIPWTFKTLEIILPYAFTLSLVGLLESFFTANVIDDLTDTSSDKNQEAIAQGIANIVMGFLGGMAGCAIIGQSVINIRSGGRSRLSSLSAGIFLLTSIIIFGDWITKIPLAVIVTIMIMVFISTFNWNFILSLTKLPKTEIAVMITTMLITVSTHNIAIGVFIGVAMSAIFFSHQIASLIFVDSLLTEDGNERVYSVNGHIFFVSVDKFIRTFDYQKNLQRVTIDLTHAHLWDQSAVDAVDKVVLRFRKHNTKVVLIGLNEASASLIERLAVHNKPDDHDNDCV